MRPNELVNLMLTLALFAAPFASQATGVYKWVDAEGVAHFSQARPPGHQAEMLDVKVTPATPAPTSEATTQGKEQAAPEENKAEGRTKPPAEQQARVDKVREENCRKAKRNLHTLQTFPVITSVDESGNPVRLDDAQKQAKIESTQKLIDEYCK